MSTERTTRTEAPTLVGRTEEIAVVRTLVGDVRSGAGGSLVIVGEPGIGKSALLRVARRLATDTGCTVLTAVGIESEAQLPYAGLHQLLSPVLDAVDELVPAHREALLTALGIGDAAPPERYVVALAALNVFVAVAARAPVVVVADDVQWLDPPTQDVLTLVARRAPAAGLVVLGAVRSWHPNPLAAAATELPLDGLDAVAADELLESAARGLRPFERDRVRDLAAGNPLALIELPRTWADGGSGSTRDHPVSVPDRLERAFGARFDALPGPARDLVLVAAVDSADDLGEILGAASVLSGRTAMLHDIAAAETARLLTVVRGRVRFRHPLMRSGVLAREALGRRQAAHAALADVLEHEPYRRTWHRAESIVGPDDEVAGQLEANVEVALARGGVVSAIRDLERSAQLTKGSALKGHRLLVAAEHAFSLGRADLVDRLLRAAATTDLSPLDLARMKWLREIFDEVPGDALRVLDLCWAARLAADADDTDLALNLLASAALRCWWADTGPEARARVVAVAEEYPGLRGDPRYVATLAVAEPVTQCATVMQLLDEIVPDSAADDGLRLLGMAAHAVGDEARAADLLQRAEAGLRAGGRFGPLPQVLSMEVQVNLELGNWDRADAAASEGRRLAEDTGQPIWTAGTLVCDARARALRGEPDRALELAAEAERTASRRRLNDLLCVVQIARGTAWLLAGRYGDAYDALARTMNPDDPSYHQRERFAGIVAYVDAALRSGHRRDAAAVVADLERLARSTPSPLLRLQTGYARAVLAPDAEAEAAFVDALEADGLDSWPWLRGRTMLAYADWLVRSRQVAEAEDVRATASETLRALGGGAWLELEGSR